MVGVVARCMFTLPVVWIDEVVSLSLIVGLVVIAAVPWFLTVAL